MKRNRFTEEQIIQALKSHEAGVKVSEICRELGIVEQTFYRWRAKYAGLGVSEAKRMKELEAENGKLKKRVAELMIDRVALKLSAHPNVPPGRRGSPLPFVYACF